MSSFSDFQLKEYDKIAEAHFKVNEMIVAFFRYYLLLMVIPITTFGAAVISIKNQEHIVLLFDWNILISAFLYVIAIIGFMIMAYISALHLRAILYARTVNSIRNYFYNIKPDEVQAINILPRDSTIPTYTKYGSHFFIVLSFAVFNTLYIVAASALWFMEVTLQQGIAAIKWYPCSSIFMILIALGSAIAHIYYHKRLAQNKDRNGIT